MLPAPDIAQEEEEEDAILLLLICRFIASEQYRRWQVGFGSFSFVAAHERTPRLCLRGRKWPMEDDDRRIIEL